jgi:hypothetical protein
MAPGCPALMPGLSADGQPVEARGFQIAT